jgi:hypothetical protein
MEIYGNPRDGAARELCIDFAVAKNTVQLVPWSSGQPVTPIRRTPAWSIDYKQYPN